MFDCLVWLLLVLLSAFKHSSADFAIHVRVTTKEVDDAVEETGTSDGMITDLTGARIFASL